MLTFSRCSLLFSLLVGLSSAQEAAPNQDPSMEEAPVKALTLAECRDLVLLNNFEIASRKLGMESARELFAGEKGSLWEPVLVLGADRVSNERENNTEEFIRQGVEDFSEDNTLYNAGIEQPLITGGALQLNYTLDHLENNLQEQRELEFEEKEWDSFAGVTLVQPLLRNGGVGIGLSVVRMAREESEVAFQEFRRQLMQSLGQAEAAYWELLIAQRRVELREKSVEVAERILEDNRARVEAGKMSDLEVREAEAGLATRRSQLLEARQTLEEASSRLLGYFALEDTPLDLRVRAVDSLESMEPPAFDEAELRRAALELHPDVLIRSHRYNQDELRVDYAANQRLPQLDLRASYGYNALGDSGSDSFDTLQDQDYPAWTVGVELRVPLGGGQRKLAELSSARSRLEQARLGIASIRRQVASAVGLSMSRVRNFHRQSGNYEEVAGMNQEILDNELKRLEAGRSDSRKVLEVEEKLTRALESRAAALTRLAVAKVELELSSGTLLRNRNVDPMFDGPAPETAAAE